MSFLCILRGDGFGGLPQTPPFLDAQVQVDSDDIVRAYRLQQDRFTCHVIHVDLVRCLVCGKLKFCFFRTSCFSVVVFFPPLKYL